MLNFCYFQRLKNAIPLVFFGLVMAFAFQEVNASPPDHARGRGHHKRNDSYYLNTNRPLNNQTFNNQDLIFNAARLVLLRNLFQNANRQDNLIDPILRNQIKGQKSLPPGIQKQLLRGKPIPPGLRNRVIPLQPSVLDYLGFQNRSSLRLGVIGSNILLFDALSGLLYDTTQQRF